MEPDWIPLHGTHSDVCKSAVNAFYESIKHDSPFAVATCRKLSRPSKMVCVWPHGEVWNHDEICLYICDTVALDRLQVAFDKVFVIDKGFAWPHVNFINVPSAVEWFMLRDDIRVSSDSPTVLSAKKWFLISGHLQDLIDYIACLHNLVPVRSTVKVIHQVGVTTAEDILCGTQADLSVTTIIERPGDIITSFFQSPDHKYYDDLSSHSSVIHHSKCVAGKSVFMNDCHTSSVVLALMGTELQYQSLTHKFPHLKSLIACRIEGCTMEHEVSLVSEISIKEEPLMSDIISCEVNMLGDANKPDLTASQFLESASGKSNCVRKSDKEDSGVSWESGHRLLRGHYQKHFGRLLQCPKCPSAFKFGHEGKGLTLLLCHINDHHKRVSSMCISVLKRRYATIFEDTHLSALEEILYPNGSNR